MDNNLKEAYCKVLACTGIGAAENNCDELLTKEVLVVVPHDMHDDYADKLLICANRVCSGDPYGWDVDQVNPSISAGTTFQNLFDNWFSEIVWE